MNLFLPEEIIQYVFNDYIAHDKQTLNLLYQFLPDFTFNISKYISTNITKLGEITIIYTYLDDKLTCEQIYTSDFKLLYECDHNGFYKDGSEFNYYANGRICYIFNYIDGKINGPSFEYDLNGPLLKYRLWKDDVCIYDQKDKNTSCFRGCTIQ